jgi:hypothetical protein
MALVYDQSNFGSTTNRTEWGGIADGVPPLSSCLQQATSFGAYTPPNGCSVMQYIHVANSDGPYFGTTGIRCLTREADPFPRRSAGYEEWQVWACLTPGGYPGDANMWISGFEHHHQGDGVAPAHWIFTASGLSLDCFGGSTAAGGIGNPGRTTTYSRTFTDAKFKVRDQWHVCMIHYLHHPTNGQYEAYHGLVGTNTSIASITGPQTGPTMFGTSQNGILFGLYKSPSGASSVTIYTAGWKHYSTFAEARDWGNTMLGADDGGGGPAPPPTINFFSPITGPIGSSVVITGTNFTGATATKLNAVNASFAVNLSTQITATVPSTTTGPWSVTAGGQTATSSTNFTVAALAPTSCFAVDNQVVQLRGVYEIHLTGTVTGNSPYDTVCNVTFTPPSGSGLAKTVQAFWDGGTVWRARVYANETGRWTWTTASPTDALLNGKSGFFDCDYSVAVNYIGGKLHKHPTNDKRWRIDDGRTFIGIGDTEYNLFSRTWDDGTTAVSTAVFQQSVADVAALKVNLIFADLNGGGYHDPTWGNFWSDVGTYDTPNLAAFQKTDERLVWMLQTWPNIYVNLNCLAESPNGDNVDTALWATLTTAKKQRFMRHIIARFAAFPQITWCWTNDTTFDGSHPNNTAMVNEVGAYFLANDKWNNLRGTGAGRNETAGFLASSWLSYVRVETGSSLEATQIATYSATAAHVYNSEDVYEGSGISNPAYYFRWLWSSWILSGGTATYGNTNYDRQVAYQATAFTGLDSAPNVANYFQTRAVDTALFTPDDSIVTDIDGATGARKPHAMVKSDQIFVYHPNSAGAGITASLKGTAAKPRVDLTAYAGTWDVEWHRLSDGTVATGTPVAGSASRDFTAPWTGVDVYLRLTAQTSAPPPPPEMTGAAVDGASLTLTYNVPLNPAKTPLEADYTVFVGTATQAPADVVVFANTVVLTLSPAAVAGQSLFVSYSQVAGREVQDNVGTAAANLNHVAVTNNTLPVASTTRLQNRARVISPPDRIVGATRRVGEGGSL